MTEPTPPQNSFGIPADARPWDVAKVTLPEGWGVVLIGSNEGDGRVRVASLAIGRLTDHGVALSAADTYTVALQSPVLVDEDELDSRPLWVDQELARRRATTLTVRPLPTEASGAGVSD